MWKPIPETDNRYEASEDGQIRNVALPVTIVRRGSSWTRMTTGKVLKTHRFRRKSSAPEYEFVWLRVGGKSKRRAVHALVLDAFVGPRKNWEQCRHLDGNSLNNKLSNLCWGTPEENRADIRRHGRTAEGERNGNTSLSLAEVLALRVMVAKGMSTYQLSKWFGVSPSTIGKIVNGESWPTVVAALEAAP